MKPKKPPKVDVFIYKIKPKMTLIALLDGPLQSAKLAKKVNMTPQGLSRLLMVAEILDLISYETVRGRRINRLTNYGRGIAENLAKGQEKAARKPEPQR